MRKRGRNPAQQTTEAMTMEKTKGQQWEEAIADAVFEDTDAAEIAGDRFRTMHEVGRFMADGEEVICWDDASLTVVGSMKHYQDTDAALADGALPELRGALDKTVGEGATINDFVQVVQAQSEDD